MEECNQCQKIKNKVKMLAEKLRLNTVSKKS